MLDEKILKVLLFAQVGVERAAEAVDFKVVHPVEGKSVEAVDAVGEDISRHVGAENQECEVAELGFYFVEVQDYFAHASKGLSGCVKSGR